MSTTMEELGRRAVACKAWRWMPGMRWVCQRPAPLDALSGRVVEVGDRQRSMTSAGAYPDLSDPATLGCLLALVREAWGDPTLHLVAFHTTTGPIFSGTRAAWWALARTPDPLTEWDHHDGPASRLVLCPESIDSTYFAAETEAEALVWALEGAP